MKNWFNRNATHFAIIGIFIVICFIYFAPAWQGKVLIQSDVTQAQAMQKEIMDFKAADGKAPLWTNSMFGGMPSYQIWVSYPKNISTHIMTGVKGIFPYPIDIVLLYLLGAYLLLNVLGIKPWLAAVGAIAFAFTSYNFIYIEAGHASQAYAIAFLPPVVAGVLWCLRGRHLLGASVLALSLALEIRVNHIQVTYYLFIALLILIGMELYHAIKEKKLAAFIKSIGFMGVAAIIALAVNAGLLWTTYEYQQRSIRGKSNIASEDKSSEQHGVSRDYAYQWSQGVGECLTFLIPNAYGGAVDKLDPNSNVAKALSGKGIDISQVPPNFFPDYWGDKPFTSGPWYFGAAVIFLFILGLFIVKGRIKWWILAATLLSIFLSWGKNFPLISDLFFNYFPLYNKFRAVESTLVIASFLVPILAILTVDELIKNRKGIEKLDKKILYSLAIVGGVSFIVWVLPDLFLSFQTSNHQQWIQALSQQLQDNSFGQSLGNALVQDRIGLARSDAFRSLIFVLLTGGIVWLFAKDKLKAPAAVAALGVLILVDLWGVDSRYLNKNSFVEKSQAQQYFFKPREVDNLILMDKSPDYRVLDLTVESFQNATPSYFHKNIGGYHAAKLMRYNELIQRQFSKSINEDVLDMLNTRYVITNGNKAGTSQSIQKRDQAAGNAWFVDRVTFVKNNEEEMHAIDSFDPKKEAFIHQEFKDKIDEKRLGQPTNASIELTSYRPDHLVYEYTAPNDVMAVFSEIWYDKGWKAFVDGAEIPILRADYVLRAAQLPGGNHKVEFKFEPNSYFMGENISLIASILLILGLIASIWLENKRTTKAA